MRSHGGVLDFQPTRLAEARVRVVSQHPSVAQLAELEPEGADLLRDRVTAAAGSRHALEELAFALTQRELLYVVRSIGIWENLRAAVGVMVHARPKEPFVMALWRAWEGYPRSDEILALLRDVVGRFGVASITSGAFVEPMSEWLTAPEPMEGVVHWLDEDRVRPKELPELPGSPFRADTPLIRRIFEHVLMSGSARQLSTFKPREIRDGWTSMDGTDRVRAGQHYLKMLAVDVWDHALLEQVRDWYGMPGVAGSIELFWVAVSEEDQRAFRRHFIAADLAAAFRGDSERHEYWKRWGDADWIVEIHRGHAGPTEWALLSFREFSVLEFFEVGNAAFFLPESEVRKIDWHRARYASELKRPMGNPVTGWGDNRLIHRQGWQHEADRMMGQWLGKYRA